MRRLVLVAAACGLAAPAAHAQPAPDKADKVDAQALVASGVKLFGAKDFLGALAVFRDAYARFPSTKILLNIATTLARLDRDAEAANTYQRYLDASDADPAKRPGVEKALAELDRKVGRVAVTVTPPEAEVQIGATGDWLPAASVARYRVTPGDVAIAARRAGFEPGSKTVRAEAGAELAVTIALAAAPTAPPPPPTTVAPPPLPPAARPAPRSPLAAIALAHVAVEHPGVAALVGVAYDALPWLALEATALIGKTSGGYAAVAVAPWPGAYRPFVVVGAPVFASSGARVSLRGGLGFELVLSRHLSLEAEVGVERALNPEPNVQKTILVPALGVTGRL